MMELIDDLFDIFPKSEAVCPAQYEDDPLFSEIDDVVDKQPCVSVEISESRTVDDGLIYIRQQLTIINE